MNLTVVCVLRHGPGNFSPVWVERLHRQVRRHLNPTRFVCLTDSVYLPMLTNQRWTDGIEAVLMPNEWPYWWAKLNLFAPGLFTGSVLYLDLDTLVLGPLPELETFLGGWSRGLHLLTDFYRPREGASGVMLWEPSEATERIYLDYARQPTYSKAPRGGDGWFIEKYPHKRLQDVLPGIFASYKAQILQDGPGDYRVICFHGKPKPHELPEDHWVSRAWVR